MEAMGCCYSPKLLLVSSISRAPIELLWKLQLTRQCRCVIRVRSGYSSLTPPTGALLAAGVTLGTGQIQSTWAWRLPALLQAVWAVLCIVVLPFM